jgi:hypothetical protein
LRPQNGKNFSGEAKMVPAGVAKSLRSGTGFAIDHGQQTTIIFPI